MFPATVLSNDATYSGSFERRTNLHVAGELSVSADHTEILNNIGILTNVLIKGNLFIRDMEMADDAPILEI